MGFLSIAIWCAAIWIALLVVFKAIDKLCPSPVVAPLFDRIGIRFTVGYINIDTKSLNASFARTARRHAAFLTIWFTVGVYIGAVLMICAVLLLCYNVVGYVRAPPETEAMDALVLTPLVPGVNVHGITLLYLLCALLVSAVVHEAGHAWAASLNHQPLRSTGLFLLFLYPGAYVAFDSDFDDLTAKRKLQIYCAGVFHNIVLAVFAIAVAWSIGIVSAPLVSSDGGVVVRTVEGPLVGHLDRGDVLVSIGPCSISEKGYATCVEHYTIGRYNDRMLLKSQYGTCIQPAREQQGKCCEEGEDQTHCFTQIGDNHMLNPSCIPPRTALESDPCTSPLDCAAGFRCLSHTTTEVEDCISDIRTSSGKQVLFAGNPWSLYHWLTVSSFVPRFGWVPVGLVDELRAFWFLFASVSMALGILNLAPVAMLDGQHALAAFIDWIFPQHGYKKRKRLFQVAIFAGTALFLANLAVSLYALIVASFS